jgi:hypothetical protein
MWFAVLWVVVKMGMSDYTILTLTTSTLRCRHCTCELTSGLRKCSHLVPGKHQTYMFMPWSLKTSITWSSLILTSVKYCFWPYAIWHHPSLVLSKSLLSSCYKLGVWWSCLQEETSHQNKRVVQVAALSRLVFANISFVIGDTDVQEFIVDKWCLATLFLLFP